jgi:acetolactate synthase I/II/III large subunit
MKLGGGAIVVRALEDEGVPFAFGIPGTHNIELYDALAGSPTVRAVLVTDEQSASFAADAVWRASGKLGCANVVPGAGLTHALSGIAEAYLDTVPMLVLGCGIRRDTGKAYQLHDVDQLALARPVTKAQLRPERGEDLYGAVRHACRLAREGVPGPVFVEVPANLYLFTHEVDLPARAPGVAPGTAHGSTPQTPTGVGPAGGDAVAAPGPSAGAADLARAVELLDAARHPLLYLGLGAAGAGDALLRLAERLEAPVFTTFQGKGVVPESHPLAAWPGFGAAAPPFAREVAAGCDATLAIGCRFGEVATGSYGLTPPGPLVHVDIDPTVPGRNFPAALALAGDAAVTVAALLERLAPRPRDEALRAAIAAGRSAVRAGWSQTADRGKVAPWRLLSALQARFGPDTIYTSDSGNGTFLAMEMLQLEGPGRFLAPVDYSCMGYAVPAALGAKLARPERPVVALAGDGAFLMTGLELLTAAHEGAALAVFVLRDRELAQIAQFQSVAMNRKTLSALPDFDVGSLCAALGVECVRLDRDEEIPAVLGRVAEVTGHGRPFVVDTAIDYGDRTFFTRGVVKTTLGRLPWPDRLRFIGRAIARRLTG